MPRVVVTSEHFSPWRSLAAHEAEVLDQAPGKVGACATFVGTMRDGNQGDGVIGMTLEHYPGMTERQLEQLVQESIDRWQLLDVLVIHRVGELLPNQTIVLLAVWSSHRREAFEACREIMEQLKSTIPFWKRELLDNGESRWVEKNSQGY